MRSAINLDNVIELIEPIIENNGAELVDVEIRGKPGNQILRVFVDTEGGGITLSLCERISRDISDILDQKDPIPGKYRLEVSSPGLDRPLKSWKDFRRNINRKVRIAFFDDEGNERKVEGFIKTAEEKRIFIEVEGSELAVPIEQIKMAKILPVW